MFGQTAATLAEFSDIVTGVREKNQTEFENVIPALRYHHSISFRHHFLYL